MKQTSDAWKGKKVFITGAEGFVGSHLAETLASRGADITYLALNRGQDREKDSIYKEKFTRVLGDVRDLESLKEGMKGADYIFHLAAQHSVRKSIEQPKFTFDVNAAGTLNVLMAARDAHGSRPLERIVIISSANVYGGGVYYPMDEKHPLIAKEPYGASKIAAEKYAESFYNTFNLPITIVRPFNMYGPRQPVEAVIPVIITQALASGVVKLGNLEPRRDFLYVKDAIEGMISSALSEKTLGETVNIGSGKDRSIGEVADLIARMVGEQTGKDVKVETDEERFRPGYVDKSRTLAGIEKIESLVGWKPEHSFEQGLEETINWFKGE